LLNQPLKRLYAKISGRPKSATNKLYLPIIVEKINESLLTLAYRQTNFGILTGLFCAVIVWFRLHSDVSHASAANFWLSILLTTTILRFFLVKTYLIIGDPNQITFWRKVFIAQATLGGGIWGLASILLLPGGTNSQQIIIIMVLAGISAGAVPFIASVLAASIIYSTLSLIPLIIYFIFLKQNADVLMALASSIFLIFLLVQGKKIHEMLANGLLLQFELHEAKDSLEYSATHDTLTKVANRNLFNKKFGQALESAKKKSTSVALIYLDLDHFKNVNDTYGHAYGDELLKAFVQRLQEIFKKEDTIARLGGDEFTVMIENIHNKSDIDKVINLIYKRGTEPILIKNNEFLIQASIGSSIFPQDGLDSDSLLNFADTAMYAAKNNRKSVKLRDK
jgi:diguanylate cyclase (GGDEF)-like protein